MHKYSVPLPRAIEHCHHHSPATLCVADHLRRKHLTLLHSRRLERFGKAQVKGATNDKILRDFREHQGGGRRTHLNSDTAIVAANVVTERYLLGAVSSTQSALWIATRTHGHSRADARTSAHRIMSTYRYICVSCISRSTALYQQRPG